MKRSPPTLLVGDSAPGNLVVPFFNCWVVLRSLTDAKTLLQKLLQLGLVKLVVVSNPCLLSTRLKMVATMVGGGGRGRGQQALAGQISYNMVPPLASLVARVAKQSRKRI